VYYENEKQRKKTPTNQRGEHCRMSIQLPALRAQMAKWAKVVKDANIKVD
jgi:hypothetical protein